MTASIRRRLKSFQAELWSELANPDGKSEERMEWVSARLIAVAFMLAGDPIYQRLNFGPDLP